MSIKKSPWVSFFNAGGCIPADTMMVLENGDIFTAKEIVDEYLEGKKFKSMKKNQVLAREYEAPILSWNGFSPKSSKITTAYKLPSTGKLVEINTSATKLSLTPDHKVLVDSIEGPTWIMAKDLKKGDYLYSPRNFNISDENKIPHLLEWLPDNFLVCFDYSYKEHLVNKLKNKFRTLKNASLKCKVSYKRLTHKPEGFTIRELKSIADKLNIDKLSISKKIKKIVKGTQKSTILSKDIDNELLYLFGLIASDGCISRNKKNKRPSYKLRFDNTNKLLIDNSMKILKKRLPDTKINCEKIDNLYRVYAYNFLLAYLGNYLGLKGLNRKKDDLRPIFKLPKSFISSFISGFFDGDGSAVISNKSRKSRISLEFSIKEFHTAKIIQLLLKRLGILSKIMASKNVSTFGTKIMHTVRITTSYDIYKFINIVKINHPQKNKKFKIIKNLLKSNVRDIGRFYQAPLICGKLLKEIRLKNGLKLKDFKNSTYLSMIENGKRVEKYSIEKICKEFGKLLGNTSEIQKIKSLISHDSYLDPVKNINEIKTNEKFVYNFTVSETNKYIPEGAFVVSNCNGCTLEVFACFNPRYDVTRFGIEHKSSAKHADVLLVTGIVTQRVKKRLLKVYEQLAEPKRVIAVGACAISGGVFKNTHAFAGPLDKVIPVDMYVPGCPPRPESIIDAIIKVLEK